MSLNRRSSTLPLALPQIRGTPHPQFDKSSNLLLLPLSNIVPVAFSCLGLWCSYDSPAQSHSCLVSAPYFSDDQSRCEFSCRPAWAQLQDEHSDKVCALLVAAWAVGTLYQSKWTGT